MNYVWIETDWKVIELCIDVCLNSIALFNAKLWACKVRGNIWASKEVEVMSKKDYFEF